LGEARRNEEGTAGRIALEAAGVRQQSIRWVAISTRRCKHCDGAVAHRLSIRRAPPVTLTAPLLSAMLLAGLEWSPEPLIGINQKADAFTSTV
jgi:hypothetical protein